MSNVLGYLDIKNNKEYGALLDLFSLLVQSRAGQAIIPGDEWTNDAQTLSIKLFRHLVSMNLIATGSTPDNNADPTVLFVDHASIKVLARAALETYLVFYHLFGCEDRTLSKFRHDTWVLGGLIDRQSSRASTKEHQEKLQSEKNEIEKLKLCIEESVHLKTYSPKQKKQLLKGKWRVGSGWVDLSENAGFDIRYFENVYSYLCGYSHSSYISALQVGQAQSIEDQKMLTQSIMGIGIIIMAHFVFSYASAFESANEVLAVNSAARSIAEKWHFGSEDMAEIYDRQ